MVGSPERRSWVTSSHGSEFPVENLPYGVFSTPGIRSPGDRQPGDRQRCGVAIGDFVVDLAPLLADAVFDRPSLNEFMARGPRAWAATRQSLTELLTDVSQRAAVEQHLVPRAAVRLHLPVEIADYVDFYASEHHATNVGRLFRPSSPPLPANWKHLPIGYHGRAGTVVVSGTPIRRPSGQRKPPGDAPPTFGPSERLDVECEVGFFVGVGSPLGSSVAPSAFTDHVFGAVLVNDWSARDIQSWEYVPLGPFLGKSFATSISPWVVPLAALDGARIASPRQDPVPLEYLRDEAPSGFDLALEIEWNGTVVSRPPFREMYWSAAQQLAHMTANGAALRTGDLFASGTVSGPGDGELGSFLEMSENGASPLRLADGSGRTFLEDGDTVTIHGSAPAARRAGRSSSTDATRIGLGEVTGTVMPAG